MDLEQNQELLEHYTQMISSETLKNTAQFLDSNLPGGRTVQKERLLAKVLAEEQAVENNRKLNANLMKEYKEMNVDLSKCDLKSLNAMRAERDELQKKRKEENVDDSVSHKASEMYQHMVLETEKLQNDIRKSTQCINENHN